MDFNFLVRSLGCWEYVDGDPVIPDNYGLIGMRACYEEAKSLDYRVFGLVNTVPSTCYISSSANDTYKKFGPSHQCPSSASIEVFEIEKGS